MMKKPEALTQAIYALCDPYTGQVMYIGRTGNPETRFRGHLGGYSFINHFAAEWLWFLSEHGLQPQMQILEWTDKDHVRQYEGMWIRLFSDRGILNRSLNPKSDYVPSRLNRAKKRVIEYLNKETTGV